MNRFAMQRDVHDVHDATVFLNFLNIKNVKNLKSDFKIHFFVVKVFDNHKKVHNLNFF